MIPWVKTLRWSKQNNDFVEAETISAGTARKLLAEACNLDKPSKGNKSMTRAEIKALFQDCVGGKVDDDRLSVFVAHNIVREFGKG